MSRIEEEMLAGLPLLADATPTDVAELAALTEERVLNTGDELMAEGEPGGRFALVVAGAAEVSRWTPGGREHLEQAGPGSILGELSLLTGEPRRASARAMHPTVIIEGGVEAFARLLEISGTLDRLERVAASRMAEITEEVPVDLRGETFFVRPLLPEDHDIYAATVAEQPVEWRMRRFFTAAPLPESVIDRLVHIDFIDHFAWVVGRHDPERGDAVGRYIRSSADPTVAEAAFGVKDGLRGRGMGTFLMGAVAVAARCAGIERLTGELLRENNAMRAVFDKADATWRGIDRGVVEATVTVEAAEALIDPDVAARLEAAVRLVVTGAGSALLHHPD